MTEPLSALTLQQQSLLLAQQARRASRELACVHGDRKNRWLNLAAIRLVESQAKLVQANQLDLAKAPEYGLSGAAIDRLKLTPTRIEAMAEGMRQVAALPDPVGQVREGSIRPNGLQVQKISVPLGVIFFLFESRPNVTVDAAALAVKSGNAIILRGGKEAFNSNLALFEILDSTLQECGLPSGSVQLVATLEREIVGHLLKLGEWIDLAIPRGGESLIRRVVSEATMPVLKHYLGNCHVYVDANANLAKAEKIIINSKCHRPGVCNAMESLLVHRSVADQFLPQMAMAFSVNGVEIRGCDETRLRIPHATVATEEDFAAEYLDLKVSIKVVPDLESAIDHINRYGSHHTDAIVTENLEASRKFTQQVDSSAVMVNASTRFNDGFELGLGAEIGISTDKFHARGPCGLQELMTYKYVVIGEGQIRGST
jgi:glutamate-5-semialdehyde dehydrogenase